ncbi:Rab9 effector protein with kelch motifs [Manis javanica]|nr:Rab9 effector protein with kelch motifs [Manis javanica]
MKLRPILEPESSPRGQRGTFALHGYNCYIWIGCSCSFLLLVCDVKRGKTFVFGGPNPNGVFSDVYPIDLASGCLEALIVSIKKITYKS